MANKSSRNNINKRKRQSPREKMERKKIRRKKAIRRARIQMILVITFIIAFLFTAFTAIRIYSFISSSGNPNIIQGNAPKGNESLNILLVGLDNGGEDNPKKQSEIKTDTIMLYNYNPITKNSKIVSIPRDMLVEADEAYEGDIYRPYSSISLAYANGGEGELIQQIEALINLDINYIVEVSYSSFRNFVDAIGGVEIQITENMKYSDESKNLNIDFNAGETLLLDGKASEEFFRWRNNNNSEESGDIKRITNQQHFISKVIKEVVSPSIILKAPKILNVIKEDITTNMSGKEIITAAYEFLNANNISMHTLKGNKEEIYGETFFVVNKDGNKELLDSLKIGNEVGNSLIKEQYKIKILNGTRVNKLASNLQVQLEKLGYSNLNIGNYNRVEESIIISNNKELTNLLRAETGINEVESDKKDKYKGYDAVIVIGEDYLVYGE